MDCESCKTEVAEGNKLCDSCVGKDLKRKKIRKVVFAFLILIYLFSSANTKMYLSLLVILIGVISVIKPLKFTGIFTRSRAMLVFCFGILFLIFSSLFLPGTNTEVQQVFSSLEDYKEEAEPINYDSLARETEKFIGSKVFLTGEIVQISESKNNIALRVNITKNEFDFYEDTIWVNYEYKPEEKKFLEDDIIQIYGDVKGRKTYTTIFGAKVILPEINARYINFIEDKELDDKQSKISGKGVSL
jgi:hypothetical protein